MSDPSCPDPPAAPGPTFAEEAAAELRLRPDGAGGWRGACPICARADSFAMHTAGRSLAGGCSACGSAEAVRALALTERRVRRARRRRQGEAAR